MLWIMHRFGEVFAQHAVVKGGMALRLYDCPRSTTDIDYVFVPFDSKKDIAADVRRTLGELVDAEVKIEMHSKMLRATVTLDRASVQVEANVAKRCVSEPMSTGSFASSLGQPAQVVRVMSPPFALAHKLATWNERRLHRDLYDVYFLRSRAGARIDLATLAERLASIESRLPALRKIRSMTIAELASQLIAAAEALDRSSIEAELKPLLPSAELAGLLPRLRVAMVGAAEQLRGEVE
jgi:predicted nucleotidyltransferase component of viral defense system